MRPILTILIAGTLLTGCANFKKKQSKDSKLAKKEDKAPFLTEPKVRKVWIPDKIENDKYIEGHWVWILERTSTWSR